MTWTADDRQFGSFSDGVGWSATGKYYNTRGLWIEGDPLRPAFQQVSGYPGFSPGPDDTCYYGFGALAVENRLYHLLCTPPKEPATKWTSGHGWNGVKLIYSEDQGRTWCNQDGSTPVAWQVHEQQSRETMLFYAEPQSAFSLVSLLQMGRNYEDNRDGYVYGYGVNGNVDGSMNELVMFRVPKDRVPHREAYEFFAGRSGQQAKWSRDIRHRAVVHTFPRGWVNVPRGRENVLQCWIPSVVYNAALGQYLMTASGVGCPPDGDWFGHSKPSYLGFWSARDPWGPWTQIYETTAWTPGHDAAARCYSPQIAPKWIAADGKSLWLVWTDFQRCDEKEFKRVSEAAQQIADPDERKRFERENALRCTPYYAFNTQRFDLVLS